MSNEEAVNKILSETVDKLLKMKFIVVEDTVDDGGRFINLSDGRYEVHMSMTYEE